MIVAVGAVNARAVMRVLGAAACTSALLTLVGGITLPDPDTPPGRPCLAAATTDLVCPLGSGSNR